MIVYVLIVNFCAATACVTPQPVGWFPKIELCEAAAMTSAKRSLARPGIVSAGAACFPNYITRLPAPDVP